MMPITNATGDEENGNDEIVNLNVGGRSFSTYKSTFLKHPDTMLARMFSTSAQLAKRGKDGEYFVDRNPDIFSVILEYYRSNKFLIPKSMSLEAFHAELEYFAIDFNEEDIQIVGEPTSGLYLENYLAVARAYASLPKQGHLLGKVVMDIDDWSNEGEVEDFIENLNDLDTQFSHGDLTTIVDDIDGRKSLGSNTASKIPSEDERATDDDSNSELDSYAKSEADSDSDSDSKSAASDSKPVSDSEQYFSNDTKFMEFFRGIRKLEISLSDISAPDVFCCGGDVYAPSVGTILTLATNNDYYAKYKINCGPITKLDLGTIKKSLAGDSDGRKFEIPLNLKHEKHCIGKLLNGNTKVHLIPHRLNIYNSGSSFTPVDYHAENIGVLVVCLPSEHKGGEVVANYKGQKQVFDFAKGSKDNTKIQWAAFSSESALEVKPIASGMRVTLTYLIRRTDKQNANCDPSGLSIGAGESLLLSSLSSVLSEVERVGIFLGGRYTSFVNSIIPEQLQEIDKALFDKLSTNASWNLQLYPVIYIDHNEMCAEDYTTRRTNTGLVYAFTTQDFKYLNNKADKPVHSIRGVHFVVGAGNALRLYQSEIPECGCDGGSDGGSKEDDNLSVYFGVALIISRI